MLLARGSVGRHAARLLPNSPGASWTPNWHQGRGSDVVVGCKCLKGFGGPGEIRTHDLFRAMADRSITCGHSTLKTKGLWRFDLFPVGGSFGVSTHVGPSFYAHGTPHASRTRAVVSAVVMFSPFRETGDEDKSFPHTCGNTANQRPARSNVAHCGRAASSTAAALNRRAVVGCITPKLGLRGSESGAYPLKLVDCFDGPLFH